MATLYVISSILMTLLVILILPGIILGIVFAVISSKEIDQIKKAKYKKIMLYSFLGPIGLILLLTILRGLILIISKS